jgi:hypothetical protein
VWLVDPYSPSARNDQYGHGTHVAGTVGGRTVGVARGANIFGVKVSFAPRCAFVLSFLQLICTIEGFGRSR